MPLPTPEMTPKVEPPLLLASDQDKRQDTNAAPRDFHFEETWNAAYLQKPGRTSSWRQRLARGIVVGKDFRKKLATARNRRKRSPTR